MRVELINRFNFIFGILLISILGIIFSNLEIPSTDAAKKSFKSKSKKSKSDFKKPSKKSKSDFKKSDFKKPSKKSKSDFKKSDFKKPSKKSKSDFKKYDKKIKDKKFKPSSFSQGSSLPSFKPVNIKDLDKDKLKDLDKDKLKDLDKDKLKDLDKDKLDKFPGISQLPYFPECGKQGNCIDIGDGINIDDGIDIDGDVDIDWDNDWDIDWDDIDVDIDDDIDVDIDDDDIDIVVRDDDDYDNDDDDDEDITYVYNYGYPESGYQESYGYEYGIFPVQEDTSPQQYYIESEVQRIVNEGSFKLHLVDSGKPFTPENNSGYILLGANQGTNNELEISNGSNGQLVILTGADDSRPVKVSSIGNIKLDLNEAILGKNDALILAYLDQSTSWVQIASKFV